MFIAALLYYYFPRTVFIVKPTPISRSFDYFKLKKENLHMQRRNTHYIRWTAKTINLNQFF